MTERQLDVFQQLWDIVNEEYIDPDFNGRDWQAIGAQYRARIQSGLTDDDFYLAMDLMLAELGDDYRPPKGTQRLRLWLRLRLWSRRRAWTGSRSSRPSSSASLRSSSLSRTPSPCTRSPSPGGWGSS